MVTCRIGRIAADRSSHRLGTRLLSSVAASCMSLVLILTFTPTSTWNLTKQIPSFEGVPDDFVSFLQTNPLLLVGGVAAIGIPALLAQARARAEQFCMTWAQAVTIFYVGCMSPQNTFHMHEGYKARLCLARSISRYGR